MKNPSAIVAADLHHVGATAESVSLAAKNAGLIAARASEHGRAFEPIASYIDAITSSTQKGTAEVEALALELARAATRYLPCTPSDATSECSTARAPRTSSPLRSNSDGVRAAPTTRACWKILSGRRGNAAPARGVEAQSSWRWLLVAAKSSAASVSFGSSRTASSASRRASARRPSLSSR